MRATRLWLGVLAVSAFAAEPRLEDLLGSVEVRYNHAKTLQVLFQERYTKAGEPRRVESGSLMLRKPGRMRWEYSQPKGKLFVSDGKYLYLYTPDDNRAERMKLQMSDDMRAPLAFLLGKLHFSKEFRNIRGIPEASGTRVAAEPQSDNLPYTQVEFLVAPNAEIHEVKVTGFDKSVLDFHFDQEKLDPPLNGKLFEFQLPKGARMIEGEQ